MYFKDCEQIHITHVIFYIDNAIKGIFIFRYVEIFYEITLCIIHL